MSKLRTLFLAASVAFAGAFGMLKAEAYYLGIDFKQGQTVFFDLSAENAAYKATVEGSTIKFADSSLGDEAPVYSYEMNDIEKIYGTESNESSINEIISAGNGAVITPMGNNKFSVSLPEGTASAVAVYAIDGRQAPASVVADGAKAVVDLGNLPAGVYVINYAGTSLKVSKK